MATHFSVTTARKIITAILAPHVPLLAAGISSQSAAQMAAQILDDKLWFRDSRSIAQNGYAYEFTHENLDIKALVLTEKDDRMIRGITFLYTPNIAHLIYSPEFQQNPLPGWEREKGVWMFTPDSRQILTPLLTSSDRQVRMLAIKIAGHSRAS